MFRQPPASSRQGPHLGIRPGHNPGQQTNISVDGSGSRAGSVEQTAARPSGVKSGDPGRDSDAELGFVWSRRLSVVCQCCVSVLWLWLNRVREISLSLTCGVVKV